MNVSDNIYEQYNVSMTLFHIPIVIQALQWFKMLIWSLWNWIFVGEWILSCLPEGRSSRYHFGLLYECPDA